MCVCGVCMRKRVKEECTKKLIWIPQKYGICHDNWMTLLQWGFFISFLKRKVSLHIYACYKMPLSPLTYLEA